MSGWLENTVSFERRGEMLFAACVVFGIIVGGVAVVVLLGVALSGVVARALW